MTHDAVAARIASLHDEEGKFWLQNVTRITDSCSAAWKLEGMHPLEGSQYSLCFKATRESLPVVLKLVFPGRDFLNESLMLEHYAGRGAIRLLEKDPASGVMLLEHADTDISLKSFFPERDEASIPIIADVMRQLHSHPNHLPLPDMAEWCASLHKPANHPAIPSRMVMSALKALNILLDTAQTSIPLHGDLHHGNILQHQGQWIAIDPKGLMGEPVFEAGAFLRNPIPEFIHHPQAQDLLSRRITKLSELTSWDSQRITSWAFVQSVLAVCWALEDNDSALEAMIACAALFERMHS